MASPGELVRKISEMFGIPEPTVAQHDRNLVVAGLRSKGGRGASAARMTPRDAAHLLVAVLGSVFVKDSVQAVHRFGETRRDRHHMNSDFSGTCIPGLLALPVEHSFVDVLTALISASEDGSLYKAMMSSGSQSGFMPFIEVTVQVPFEMGDISIRGGKKGMSGHARYAMPNPWDVHDTPHPPSDEVAMWEAKAQERHTDLDLTQYRRFTVRTVLALGTLLRGSKRHVGGCVQSGPTSVVTET